MESASPGLHGMAALAALVVEVVGGGRDRSAARSRRRGLYLSRRRFGLRLLAVDVGGDHDASGRRGSWFGAKHRALAFQDGRFTGTPNRGRQGRGRVGGTGELPPRAPPRGSSAAGRSARVRSSSAPRGAARRAPSPRRRSRPRSLLSTTVDRRGRAPRRARAATCAQSPASMPAATPATRPASITSENCDRRADLSVLALARTLRDEDFIRASKGVRGIDVSF